MMKNIRNNIIYSFSIVLLLVGNVYIAYKLFMHHNNNSGDIKWQLNDVLPPVQIETYDNNIIIPSQSKAITLIYLCPFNDNSIGYIGFLDALKRTSLHEELEVIIVDGQNKYTEYTNYLNAYHLIYTNDYSTIMKYWGINLMKYNCIVVFYGNRIVYNGELLRDHIYTYLYKLLHKEAQDALEMANNISITSRIENIENNNVVDITNGIMLLVIMPSYCRKCGDDEMIQELLLHTNIEPLIIYPSNHPKIVVKLFKHISAHGMDTYILDMNSTNITYDNILYTYPKIIVANKSEVIYTNKRGESKKKMIEDIISCLSTIKEG